ncbi:serine hydrolase [Variovorax sp. PCZ-1]|uniref:serine hydrolase domain-containing protein n=1 Tax=Variovorax sp. PCZ-1 TaxID=2835533 RepID=UPI001BD175E0|nr:serine hydrolase [Variovorax sp. PCZ-1]MBS7807655.1 serine hydrolase [Variovorax sp. PCZ-1]
MSDSVFMKSIQALIAIPLLTMIQMAAAQSGCSQGFINPHRLYLHNEAKASVTPLSLAAGEPLGTVMYKARKDSQLSSLDDYLGKFCTTGFLVLHKGQVVFEKYQQGVRPDDMLLSASMSKTILSLIMGVAIAEGKLALNDRVQDILPDFKDSAFADNTIEELLCMTTGVELKNSYVRGETSDNQATNPMISPRQNMRSYLSQKKGLAAAGKRFDYNGAVSALLGLTLSARTGKSNTDYLAEKIWQPMGAKSNGYWIKNNNGEEGVQGQFAATLSDYAKLGYLVMNQGAINGKQLIPASWIAHMTTLRRDLPQSSGPPYYGLHVWIPQAAGGRSFFWGTNGQNIFVDPIAQVVIVHTGNSPNAEFHGNDHLFPLRDAIVTKLSSR